MRAEKPATKRQYPSISRWICCSPLEPFVVHSVEAVVGVLRVRATARNETMAGRYQGYHCLPNNSKSIEIFWRADGWWWWPRVTGHPPNGAPLGPFLTSTEAYLNASAGAVLMPPASPYRQSATAQLVQSNKPVNGIWSVAREFFADDRP